MEKFHVPVMADSLIPEIATFHTTDILVVDLSKFPFIGIIPESMYQCASKVSIVISKYKKLPAIGQRSLTTEMQKSLNEADKPAKRGKKRDTKKEVQEGTSSKPVTPMRGHLLNLSWNQP